MDVVHDYTCRLWKNWVVEFPGDLLEVVVVFACQDACLEETRYVVAEEDEDCWDVKPF